MFGLGLSVVLSIAVSAAFGAGGMIVLGSGLLSTMITQVYYSLPESTYQGVLARKAEFSSYVEQNRRRWYKNVVLTARTLRFIWAVCILPFRLLFVVIDAVNKGAEKVHLSKVRL